MPDGGGSYVIRALLYAPLCMWPSCSATWSPRLRSDQPDRSACALQRGVGGRYGLKPVADDQIQGRCLGAIEDEILRRTSNVRECCVFLTTDGRVLLSREGEADSVVWTVDELTPYIGSVDLITHNHPRGTSLTPEDLSLARFLTAREVDAITPLSRFRLLRVADCWPRGDQLQAAISEVQRALVQEVQEHLEAGRISEGEADVLFYRVLWERVAA